MTSRDIARSRWWKSTVSLTAFESWRRIPMQAIKMKSLQLSSHELETSHHSGVELQLFPRQRPAAY